MNVPLNTPLPVRQGLAPPAGATVRLAGLATALPPHILRQDEVTARAHALLAPRYPQFDRIAAAFQNAGIDQRGSVVPLDWFGGDHGWQARTEPYLAGATALFRDAADRALAAAGVSAGGSCRGRTGCDQCGVGGRLAACGKNAAGFMPCMPPSSVPCAYGIDMDGT